MKYTWVILVICIPLNTSYFIQPCNLGVENAIHGAGSHPRAY